VGHKFWSWAYEKYADDLRQEACLCALLYDDDPEYLKKCNRHIRKLLRGFGYREAYRDYDRNISIVDWNTQFWTIGRVKAIEYLNRLYLDGFDYHQVCNVFNIKSIRRRIDVRDLMRECFAGAQVKNPMFVTPHAIQRLRERVVELPRQQAIDYILNQLQAYELTDVSRYCDGYTVKTKDFEAVIVEDSALEWASVVTILPGRKN